MIQSMRRKLFQSLFDSVHLDGNTTFPLLFILLLRLARNKRFKLVSLEWLDENKAGFRRTLEPEKPGYSYGPSINGVQRLKQIRFPAINLYCFEAARVSARSSSILLDRKIIVERVEHVDMQRCDLTGAIIIKHGNTRAIVNERPTRHLENGIFLGGSGSFNYYHWMIEILPRLQFLQNIDEEYHGFPILVSEDATHTDTFREALNLIVKDRSIIELDKDSLYSVGKILYISTPNKCPYNLRYNQQLRVSDFITRASSINYLRNQLCPELEESARTGGNRIFLERRSGRRDYNQNEIYPIFERQGFSKVLMEELSLQDQIDVVSGAEMIAGPTGAAWTNLLFCRRGTRCLCWMADEWSEFSGYSNLAKIVGADLRYVGFKTGFRSTAQLSSQSYSVDAALITNSLDDLMRSQPSLVEGSLE